MDDSFYSRFSEVSLAVLGFWLVVVEHRHEVLGSRGTDRRALRRQATAVSLVVGVPGVLSLVALIDPEDENVWQISFLLGVAGGAVGILWAILRLAVIGRAWVLRQLALWAAALLLLAVALVALLAMYDQVEDPLKLEAGLFATIFAIGLVTAWSLVVEPQVDRPPSLDR